MAQNLASGATLWRPQGPRWVAFRARLFASWGGTPDCFACAHPVHGPAAGEVEHRISTALRPDLAWTTRWMAEPFLVPVHGSGRKRCGDCGLACNSVIGSNAARRDDLGRSVPLTAAEIAAAQARARARPRSSTGRDRRENVPHVTKVPETGARPRIDPVAGRSWL